MVAAARVVDAAAGVTAARAADAAHSKRGLSSALSSTTSVQPVASPTRNLLESLSRMAEKGRVAFVQPPGSGLQIMIAPRTPQVGRHWWSAG